MPKMNGALVHSFRRKNYSKQDIWKPYRLNFAEKRMFFIFQILAETTREKITESHTTLYCVTVF